MKTVRNGLIAAALAICMTACATTKGYDKFADGQEALRLGKADAAITRFNEAIAIDPTVYNYFVQRSQAYELKQMYTNAIADLAEAIRLIPRDYPDLRASYFTRMGAFCLYETGDYTAAIENYETALNLYENDPYIKAHDVWRDFRITGLNGQIAKAKGKASGP